MAHQLSALVALIETQIQVPAPTWWFTSNHNSTSRESNPPLLTFAMQVKHSCIQNKINQSFFLSSIYKSHCCRGSQVGGHLAGSTTAKVRESI